MVEQSAVNRLVAGSSPAWGVLNFIINNLNHLFQNLSYNKIIIYLDGFSKNQKSNIFKL